jgi:hypothetical protein
MCTVVNPAPVGGTGCQLAALVPGHDLQPHGLAPVQHLGPLCTPPAAWPWWTTHTGLMITYTQDSHPGSSS